MRLRALCWNVRRARHNSPAWDIIRAVDPDVITLQEVIDLPQDLLANYATLTAKATAKSGKPQVFGSAILLRGERKQGFQLESEFDWVNQEIEFFRGNLLSCEAAIEGVGNLKITSVYNPAWPLESERLQNIDISPVKLKNNSKLWCTELLWAGLRNEANLKDENWIVAGDFNSSVTFDYMWGKKPRGNQEIIDRMNSIGLQECLAGFAGKLTPTFRNPKGGKIIHQLDHMYVTEPLFACLVKSYVADTMGILENSLSDHLPIISEFNFKV